jgi:excisionase family DNA binding protein
MTILQAVQHTGLSDKTLRRLVREGKLTGYRPVGGRLLLSVVELTAFIEASAANKCTRGKPQAS